MNHVLNEPLSEIVKGKFRTWIMLREKAVQKFGTFYHFYDFRNSNFSLSLFGIQTCYTISNELRSA